MPFHPQLVEARLALGQIDADRMVELALDALEAGLDGREIRRMAALVQPSAFEVDEHRAAFMIEAGLCDISTAEACRRLAVDLAKTILEAGDDPLIYVDRFERWLMQARYPAEFDSLGLIAEDVCVARQMGESEKNIRRWVTERLRDFLRDNLK